MIGYKALRGMFSGRLEEAKNGQNDTRAYAKGRIAALRESHDLLGLESDEYGNPLVQLDERGLPTLREGRALPKEFSLRWIGEAIFGHEAFEEVYHPGSG